jgi:hypothetical protein
MSVQRTRPVMPVERGLGAQPRGILLCDGENPSKKTVALTFYSASDAFDRANIGANPQNHGLDSRSTDIAPQIAGRMHIGQLMFDFRTSGCYMGSDALEETHGSFDRSVC